MVFPVSWLLISSVDMLQVMYGGCPLEHKHNSLIIDLTYFQTRELPGVALVNSPISQIFTII